MGLLPRRYSAPSELRQWLVNRALLYTACDEDSWSELRGLDIAPDDDVLSITGSGCRSLNLLLAGPRRLVSYDVNPLQSHLLELKVAAIRRLSHREFGEFIGLHPGTGRRATWHAIRGELSDDARGFWDLNEHVIERGVLYSGAHETYYRTVIRPAVATLRRRKLRRLFELETLDEQRRFYHAEWNTWWWRTVLRGALRPWLFKLVLPDPSYYTHPTFEGYDSMADYCLARVEHAFTSSLVRDNHFLALLLLGHYHNDQAVPPYLHPEHYERIRANLPALEIVTGPPLDEWLASIPDGTFDKFSLSDISGWIDEDAFAATLRDVVRTGRDGGRICYRNFAAQRKIPAGLLDSIDPLDDLAAELTDSDLAFAYTFQCGVLKKPAAPGEARPALERVPA
jgi:S-adenosylmethionine-diacylglycerol 3-amino-3-carboxypropyl transferase